MSLQGSDIEHHLLGAMAELANDGPLYYAKCDRILRHALQAADKWTTSAETALCISGEEDADVWRFFTVLRQLVLDGLAAGQGDLKLPAGPRYTECRITERGLSQLQQQEQP